MYETFLILHFLGIAAGVGVAFAMPVLGAVAARMPAGEGDQFMLRAAALSKLSAAGLSVAILSGGALMGLSHGLWQAGGWPFWLKLALVAALVAVLGAIHLQQSKAARGTDAALALLPKLGATALALSIAIVVLAVVAFG